MSSCAASHALYVYVGSLTVDGMPVRHVHKTANSVVYILERILFIRPEDISAAVSRISQGVTLR